MKRKSLFLLFFLLTLGLVPPANGLMVRQMNLHQLTTFSERVFVGKCLSVKNQRDEAGREVQWVTFQVKEMLKGTPVPQVKFKQLAGKGIGAELPQYRVGEEAVLFLAGAHPVTGLSAPIALAQGKFAVREAADGGREVINGVQNQGLFFGMKKVSKLKAFSLPSSPRGPVPYDDFVSIVKKLVP